MWGNVDSRMQPIVVPPDSSVRVTAHVHGLPEPAPVVDWIARRTEARWRSFRGGAVLGRRPAADRSDSGGAYAAGRGRSGEHSPNVRCDGDRHDRRCDGDDESRSDRASLRGRRRRAAESVSRRRAERDAAVRARSRVDSAKQTADARAARCGEVALRRRTGLCTEDRDAATECRREFASIRCRQSLHLAPHESRELFVQLRGNIAGHGSTADRARWYSERRAEPRKRSVTKRAFRSSSENISRRFG